MGKPLGKEAAVDSERTFKVENNQPEEKEDEANPTEQKPLGKEAGNIMLVRTRGMMDSTCWRLRAN